MLQIYRRHLKSCSHTSRSYRRCPCPIWVQGTLGGETIRRAMDVTSIEAASNLVAQWNAAGEIGAVKQEPARIDDAVAKYLDDARARHLAEATITKLTTIFEKQFLVFANDEGLRYLKELTPARLTAWRSTWKDQALAASKKYQRVVGFFYFCMRMKWLTENPMKSLHPPKVKQDPTLPFTPDEVNAIVSACDRFPLKGIYGEGNRKRLRAMTLLLRYSGLRIRDAAAGAAAEREAPPLHAEDRSTRLRSTPALRRRSARRNAERSPELLFLVGQRTPENHRCGLAAVAPKLFEIANVWGGHAHRFRDTFAVELLLAGVPIDQVSILLGHSSVKITEKSYSPWVKARQEQLEAAVMKAWPTAPKLRLLTNDSAS